MPKYFFKPSERNGDVIVLKEDAAHHLLQVLRIKSGSRVILCDGAGVDYASTLEMADVKKGLCSFRILNEIPCETELPRKTTLFQALPKSDKMEWIIQKCVELGVHQIVPLYTAFTVVRDAEKKMVRFNRVAESAAGQSMRGIVPEVALPMAFKDAVKEIVVGEPRVKSRATHLVALSPSEVADLPQVERCSIKEWFASNAALTDSPLAIWVGPEGGFSPEEITALLDAGVQPISLGRRVLRTETAGLTALAQIMLFAE